MQPFLVAAVVWVCSGSFLDCGFLPRAVGSGDFNPETALLAALACGQTSCSVSCIITMFLEVSEVNRTSYPLLCWGGHQGMLFLQRRMGKTWNVALQMWLFFLKSEEPVSSAGGSSGVSAAFSAPAVSAESCSMRGELETNFESESLKCTGILHYRDFSVTERLQLSVTRSDGIQILFKLTHGATGL